MKIPIEKIKKILLEDKIHPYHLEALHKWLLYDENELEKENLLHTTWLQTNSFYDNQTFDSLKNVLDKIEELETNYNEKTIPGKKRSIPLILIQIAASLILILASSYFTKLYLSKNIVELEMTHRVVPPGEIEEIILPDSTRVKLNSMSALIYPSSFTGKTRSVYLIGEAVFSVAQNQEKPFIAKLDGVEVEALGTKFNISAYPDDKDIKTFLIEGKVEIRNTITSEKTILNPGQQLVYHKDNWKSELLRPDMEDVIAWTHGNLILKSTSITDILKVMERRYNVRFQYNASQMSQDKFNIKFKEDTSLKEALSILNYLIGPLSYEIDDNRNCKLIIRKNV